MNALLLAWLGTVALLATLGLFYRFGDKWTGVLVEFTAAMLWALFALSSMDVILTTGTSDPVSQPVRPLFFLGIGMALGTFAYGLYDLMAGAGTEAEEADLAKSIR
jgi:hypothetical protein